MDRIITKTSRVVDLLAKVINPISYLALFLMMLLTVADVFMRKVFNNSILGTVEVTELMMVVLIFFSLAHTEIADGHVKVDLVLSRFTPKVQSIFDIFTQLVCFGLFCLLTWSSFKYAASMRASGEVTQDLLIPIYPFVYIVALGSAFLSLALLLKFLKALVKVIE